MGQTQTKDHWMWQPDLVKEDPNLGVPKYDPMLGFPNGRKERVMVATEKEMESAFLPLEFRDYCAHLYLDYLGCLKSNYPLMYKCHHVHHTYKECEYEDYVLRMKEKEREKRITTLQAKKEKDGA